MSILIFKYNSSNKYHLLSAYFGSDTMLRTLCGFFFKKLGTSQVALVVKNPPASAGGTRDAGSIPELGRSPGGGIDNPIKYS